MTQTHTPGTWQVGADDRNGQAIIRNEHIEIATCWHHCVGSIEKEMRANARRIVSCVNALDGLPQDALDGGWTSAGISAYAKRLEGTNADLLAALKRCRFDSLNMSLADLEFCRAAIVNAEKVIA